MIFYKLLWLIIVAYPLWAAGTLKGSSAEGMANVFICALIPALFVPWRYVVRKYVLISARAHKS